MNVVAFGDHLRPDQQVEFSGIQSAQRTLEISMAAHRIAIESSNAGLRKISVQQFLQLFRACAQKINVLTSALYAAFRHRSSETAVMALHPAALFVMRQRNRAISAFERLAACPAQHDRRIPAPIEQHHRLFFALQAQPDSFNQLS